MAYYHWTATAVLNPSNGNRVRGNRIQNLWPSNHDFANDLAPSNAQADTCALQLISALMEQPPIVRSTLRFASHV